MHLRYALSWKLELWAVNDESTNADDNIIALFRFGGLPTLDVNDFSFPLPKLTEKLRLADDTPVGWQTLYIGERQ